MIAASPPRADCSRVFTVHEARVYADRIYAGDGLVTRRELRRLGRMEMCQRNPRAQPVARRVDHAAARAHTLRVYAVEHPWSYATASWYDDSSGRCAFGPCLSDGVANLSLPDGTRVEFSYGGRIAFAVVDDRGPYVDGRTWDLDQNVAGALGFSGVGSVGYRILR